MKCASANVKCAQQNTIQEAAFTPGHALQVGIQRKLSAHLPSCRAAGVEFIPIVAETLGGLAQDTVYVVRTLGEALAQQGGYQDPTTTTSHLFNRLSIALWRGNACLWLHRQPPPPPTVDGAF